MANPAGGPDVLVLGAGIVGVCIALHLQQRGRGVLLVDRNPGAGEGTSFGNAGIIERSSVIPYMFPRNMALLMQYGLNRRPEAHYHLSALAKVAPFLVRYWLNSTPARKAQIQAANLPLIENSLKEHEALAAAAGISAALRPDGWIKAFRDEASLAAYQADMATLAGFGLTIDLLDQAELQRREPHLNAEVFKGGVHLRDPATVADPEAFTKAYAGLLVARGGRMAQGDAKSLRQEGAGWSVETAGGRVIARDAVVALGPWSSDVYEPLGYRLPLGVKRGYHMHFSAKGNAMLNRPLLDADRGYVLAPMARGIRLTTGAEFAERDAPATPVQLAQTEPFAREILPLDARVDAEPWLGRRPCLPDMTPVIGPAPRHAGLWFAFGHHHHGLTNGAITGRLLAELITGEAPCINPEPYRMSRF